MAPTLNPIFLNSVYLLFKIGFIIFAILYFVFTLVVIRQVALMTETVRTEAEGFLRLISFLFAFLALGVLTYFIVLL